MMRSLYSGVSGLVNHQVRMDVLGNNISNVNTYGFKRERVTFQDIISQMVEASAKPTDERGGINSKQIGLGMTVASIDKIMTQGSIQTTGINTDLSIAGEGFFVLKKGDQLFYSRAGNFYIDKNGTLVNSSGFKVQGWKAQKLETGEIIINPSGQIEDLVIPRGAKSPAAATTVVKYRSNLDGRTPVLTPQSSLLDREKYTHKTSVDIFDSYGNRYRMFIDFVRTDLNTWVATVNVENSSGVVVSVGEEKVDNNNQFTIVFDNKGTLRSISDNSVNPTVMDSGTLMANVSFTLPDGTRQTVKVELGVVGSIENSITQFSSPSTASVYDQDGHAMGYLESFKIDSSGTIIGVFTNGLQEPLGQVALAGFTNPQGLEKVGENLYIETMNSGLADISPAEIKGKGKIYSGALEMSNVDLSDAFVDMIVTQRGFQANSRTITTTDQMLQEILNLKR
ncbi:MAG: flagellar hook protein FlgE [Brevinematales bacterium]|nr:flagellar hook protein FlgE [Brevinematales bacterium]